MRPMVMNGPITASRSMRLPTCPDCGGILALTRLAALTSVEVAAADAAPEAELQVCQCLLCGYQETRRIEPPTLERL
jgi:hypothetical protein